MKAKVRRVGMTGWHVFVGRCQVAGPYTDKIRAEAVRDEIESEAVKFQRASANRGEVGDQ